MFWDEGFESWQGFGIASQPAAILVERDGTVVKKWQGELSDDDRDEIVSLARKSS